MSGATVTVTINDAVDALLDRKESVMGEREGAFVGPDQIDLLAVGLEIDLAELQEAAEYATRIYRALLIGGGDPTLPIVSAYADGVLTGMLLMQLRRERE
jgi:hypothetical protein